MNRQVEKTIPLPNTNEGQVWPGGGTKQWHSQKLCAGIRGRPERLPSPSLPSSALSSPSLSSPSLEIGPLNPASGSGGAP